MQSTSCWTCQRGNRRAYVFATASVTIRVSGKEGGVGNLRRGDVGGVLYTETEGARIAKMVLVTDTEPAQEKKTEEKGHETKPATCLEKAGSDQAPKGRLREEVRRYIQDGKSGDPEEEGGEVVARRR